MAVRTIEQAKRDLDLLLRPDEDMAQGQEPGKPGSDALVGALSVSPLPHALVGPRAQTAIPQQFRRAYAPFDACGGAVTLASCERETESSTLRSINILVGLLGYG